MGFLGSIFKGAENVGSQIGSLFGGGNPKYKSEKDLPWFERSLLKAGAGLEGIDKKIMGIVGLEDYAPSSITDIQDKIKTDISQKGYSSGWDWNTFWHGSTPYKTYDQFFNDKEELDKSLPSSLDTGAGISGGGQNNMGDDLPNRLGVGQSASSYGKAIAVEDEPGLNDQNYNLNNFNF